VKTILAGYSIPGYLGAWTLTIKCVGMMLTAACGLNLGKEAPMLHVVCCVGNIVARVFPKYKNKAKEREVCTGWLTTHIIP
jgi:chloride channel 3/4/5